MNESIRIRGLDILRQGSGRRGNEFFPIPFGESKVAGLGEVDLGARGGCGYGAEIGVGGGGTMGCVAAEDGIVVCGGETG